MRELHVKLVELQEWVLRHERKKSCILFEGRDGAGKGGVIKAITARVNPREFRVVALPAATEREKSQMYIQRYLPHLPSGGAVVIFEDLRCIEQGSVSLPQSQLDPDGVFQVLSVFRRHIGATANAQPAIRSSLRVSASDLTLLDDVSCTIPPLPLSKTTPFVVFETDA